MGYDGNNETLYIKLDRSALRYEADFYIKDLGGIECSNSDILARVRHMPFTISNIRAICLYPLPRWSRRSTAFILN